MQFSGKDCCTQCEKSDFELVDSKSETGENDKLRLRDFADNADSDADDSDEDHQFYNDMCQVTNTVQGHNPKNPLRSPTPLQAYWAPRPMRLRRPPATTARPDDRLGSAGWKPLRL